MQRAKYAPSCSLLLLGGGGGAEGEKRIRKLTGQDKDRNITYQLPSWAKETQYVENSFNFLPVSISSIVEPDIAVPVTGQPINSSHTGYPAVSLVPKPFHITQKNPYNIIKVIINIAICILSCMQSVLIYLPMILLEIIC